MSNGHGGKRDGAGRRKGSAHVKTRKVADRLASDDGATPLDVMVGAMRIMWAKAEALKDKPEREAERLDYAVQASELASKAAPYIHPRLAAVEHLGNEAKPLQVNITDREAARRLFFAVALDGQQSKENFH